MSSNTFHTSIIQMEQALKFFALKFTQNSNEIADLVQETMLKALLNKDKYTPDTNLKAWLFTILKNQFINEYRKKSRTIEYLDKKAKHSEIDSLHNKAGFESDSGLNIDDIRKSINSLEKNYRLPLQMYLHGYKYKDIAEVLEIPLGTVKRRIFSSRKKLEKKLMPNAA